MNIGAFNTRTHCKSERSSPGQVNSTQTHTHSPDHHLTGNAITGWPSTRSELLLSSRHSLVEMVHIQYDSLLLWSLPHISQNDHSSGWLSRRSTADEDLRDSICCGSLGSREFLQRMCISESEQVRLFGLKYLALFLINHEMGFCSDSSSGIAFASNWFSFENVSLG